ncbi:MAG: hypothetical protein US69_C0010G0017 [candidate division TM6 bacterium GW2011_GWF2_38_10]|nr:MAG: hypothetical protein US69_C0010G0017 [candidate division TM6 bacterium GW2011_GWF2_38_10]
MKHRYILYGILGACFGFVWYGSLCALKILLPGVVNFKKDFSYMRRNACYDTVEIIDSSRLSKGCCIVDFDHNDVVQAFYVKFKDIMDCNICSVIQSSPHIRYVTIENSPWLTIRGYRLLSQFQFLHTVVLVSLHITQEMMSELVCIPYLEHVNFINCYISDDALLSLVDAVSLKSIFIEKVSTITSAGLSILTSFPDLESVCIGQCSVGKNIFYELGGQERFGMLKHFIVDGDDLLEASEPGFFEFHEPKKTYNTSYKTNDNKSDNSFFGSDEICSAQYQSSCCLLT